MYGLIFVAITVTLGLKMHVKQYLPAALSVLPTLAQAQPASPPSNSPAETTGDPFQVYTISAENITAKFIPYGARLISLLVPDRDGNLQDIAVGYDDPRQYVKDTEGKHTYFGAVVGRYANRIKNGTFEIDGKEYHVPANENNGMDTLHGGFVGYDQRNWTVTSTSKNAVTFTLLDKALEDFPGDVITHATFSVDTPENPAGLPQLTTKLVSLSLTQKTPIMLSNHIYWNLNSFKEPTILDNTFLQLPLSQRYVGTDGILIPNGTILDVSQSPHSSMDFTAGKLVGQDLQYTEGICGTDCVGYDNCFIVDRPPSFAPDSLIPVLRLNSSTTGISMEVSTNQPALQIYACNGMDGSIPVKPSQVKRNQASGQGSVDTIQKHGCIVIEPEGWIDGINNPQWGQLPSQIFSPETGPAVNWATYKFGTIG
ncbi:hypothetical protein VTN00DRAFT_8125 [Thermoascus crustaceus]|uniref:uncharacterized protein n=1 Tax=Thermoascus crustaceus TaxID=5088 RepID=UPI003742AED2